MVNTLHSTFRIRPSRLLSKIIIVSIFAGGFFPNMGFSESIYTERRLGSMSISSQTSQIAAKFFIPGPEALGNIRFWSIDDGRLRNIIELGKGESAWIITFSHAGNLMAVADIGCYSFKENRWLWKFKWLDDRPGLDEIFRLRAESMIFTPDDTKIFVAGSAYFLVYDSKTGEILEKKGGPFQDYPEIEGCAIRSAFSPSGNLLAVWQEFSTAAHGGWWKRFKVNKWVTVWDTNKNQVVSRLEKPKSEMCPGVFSTDEREIAFGSRDGQIRVYSIPEQKLVREWKAHSRSKDSKGYPFPVIISLALSSGSKYLASKGFGDGGDEIKIWHFQKGELAHEFHNVASEINCMAYPMAFSPDGKYFALEQQGKLCLYDTQTWQEKWCVHSSAKGKD